MVLERKSPCKINLILNILGKRPDGFHELETLMYPIGIWDRITLERVAKPGIELTCNDSQLPADRTNLVWKAAHAFLDAASVESGLRIRLEKKVPLAAGLGGGSSNAANTLLGLNEMFGHPLTEGRLAELASAIGSDVAFFLQPFPATAHGRGERIVAHSFFPVLTGLHVVLIHPGFGVSTAWAYQRLARFPEVLNGRPGRVLDLIEKLDRHDLAGAAGCFYNSLERPVLEKFPILAMYQEFFREHGAIASLMSGSGSTTFALIQGEGAAHDLAGRFQEKFGRTGWIGIVPM